jgi:Ca-activated chloride channel family protein
MTFVWPLALLSLLLVPVLVGVYVLLERRRRGQAARFGNPELFPNIVRDSGGRLRHLPELVLLVALTALLVGLARPRAAVDKTHETSTIVLAIDTSRSMAATDVLPTRLAAAESAARQFIAIVPKSYRVGIVAFSSSAAVAAPASTDRTVALRALSELRTGSGTAIGDAIMQSITVGRKVLGASPTAAPPPVSVLLLSDGAQTSGKVTPDEATVRAHGLGVKVSTVALGTPNAVVTVPLQGGLKEQIAVPADRDTLKRVAEGTGGQFYDAPTAKELSAVYRTLGSHLGHVRGQRELTDLFAAGGAVLLLVAGGLATLLFRRFP